MRLVHVVTVPDSLVFLRGQCAYMAAQGHDVTVVSAPDERLTEFARREGVTGVGVPMRRAITPVADTVALLRLTWRLWRLRPDVVHAHTPKGGLLGMMAAWLARVPGRIYHIHGLPFETAAGMRRLVLVTSERVSCRLATRVLSVSHSALRLAELEGVCPPGKGDVLLSGSINGVDSEHFHRERNAPAAEAMRRQLGIDRQEGVVGFVGRVVRDKGIEELEAAWQYVRTRCPEAHLVVAGMIELGDPVLPAVLDRLRADQRVHLLGFVPDPAPVYGAMSVLALPSRREGFGLAALEAAATGVPVVASRIAGLVDAVVDGETGILVPSRDPNALAEALCTYLADGAQREAHGEAGRRRARSSFRPEDMWRALSACYADENESAHTGTEPSS